MKLVDLKAKILANETVAVDMMRNPADLAEWVVWVRVQDGKSFLLMNDSERVIATTDVNEVLLLLRSQGVKQANIIL